MEKMTQSGPRVQVSLWLMPEDAAKLRRLAARPREGGFGHYSQPEIVHMALEALDPTPTDPADGLSLEEIDAEIERRRLLREGEGGDGA